MSAMAGPATRVGPETPAVTPAPKMNKSMDELPAVAEAGGAQALAAPCAVEPKEPASAASTGQRQQELTASAAREAVGAAVGTARAVVKFQQRNPSGRRLVTLRLRRVDLLSLTEIDQLRQVFTAQLYVTFCIPGGAEDPCLCSELHKEKPAFPIGPDGKPTFRPPAGWYLNQLDFSNAVDVRLIDKAIMQSGSDLVLSARYQGTFSEALELERFPFDAQPLTISMVVNCRESGPVPVAIELDDLVAKSVDPRKSFALYQEWHLADLICVRVGRTSADIADRVFPQISFSFFVARRPGFVLTNVALPTLLISTLSFVPFCLDPMDYIADRFALLFALVLTTVTFKSIISTMVPAIAYLTWVDKYVLASSLCVFASMLISALVFVVPSPDPRRTDNIACACLGVVWLCAQLYYGAQAIRAVQKKRDILAQLSSDIGDASSGSSLSEVTHVRSTSRMKHSRIVKLRRRSSHGEARPSAGDRGSGSRPGLRPSASHRPSSTGGDGRDARREAEHVSDNAIENSSTTMQPRGGAEVESREAAHGRGVDMAPRCDLGGVTLMNREDSTLLKA